MTAADLIVLALIGLCVLTAVGIAIDAWATARHREQQDREWRFLQRELERRQRAARDIHDFEVHP